MTATMPVPVTVTTSEQLAALLREVLTEIFDERTAERPAAPLVVPGSELCRLLSISRSTLHRMRVGGMPALRVGDTYRYEPAACLTWLREQQ